MATEVIATTASSKGTLAAIGSAAKTLVLVHPIGVAAVGGALVGWGTYYAMGKFLNKKKAAEPDVAAA